MRIPIWAAILILAQTAPILAESSSFGRKSVGTSGAQFLKLGVNARAIGMGEAYSSIADGSDAIFWNPAGLDKVEKRAFSFMHASYFQGIFYDFASYAHKVRRIGTVGMSVQYVGSNGLEQTNESGAKVGTFNPYDLAMSFGWARRVKGLNNKEFAVGLSAKIIHSKILETATGGAVDIGTMWNPYEELWLNAAVQNVGGQIKYKSEGDELPLNIKVGSSYRVSWPWIVALDANFPRDNDPNVSLGTEYRKRFTRQSWMAGRTGYSSRTTPDVPGLSGISAGVGFGGKIYSFDFAWVPFGDLGNTYRFSLSGRF